MAVAALIVSIAIALLSGAGLFYLHQQTSANKEEIMVLKDNLRDQRTPTLTAKIEDLGSWHRLRVRLTSQWPLTAIQVTLLGDGHLQFTDSQNGVTPGTPVPRHTATWSSDHPDQGELQPGDSAVWRIDLGEAQRQGPRPEELRLRIECTGHDRGDRWTVTASTPLPPPPPATARSDPSQPPTRIP